MTPPEAVGRPEKPASAGRVESGRAAPTPVAGGLSLLSAAIGAALLAVLVASLGETYESVQENDGLASVDHPLLDWMVAHRSPGLDSVVTFFTDIGGTTLLPIIVLVLVVTLAWRWHSWTPVALTLVATAGSLAMTEAGKHLAGRARPPTSLAVPPFESSPSFPSGHTLNSTVVAIVLAYLVALHVERQPTRVLLMTGLALYAVAMGLSRVFLGHHWFTDVVAGWCAGAAWGLVVVVAHRLLVTLQRRRHLEVALPSSVSST